MSPLELKLKENIPMTRRLSVMRDGEVKGKASLYLFEDGSSVVVGVTRSGRVICDQYEAGDLVEGSPLDNALVNFAAGIESLGFTAKCFDNALGQDLELD